MEAGPLKRQRDALPAASRGEIGCLQDLLLTFRSFFLSADGRFAALQGINEDPARSGEPASVPIVSLLEFRNGKITKETLYYDGRLFKRHLLNRSGT